MTPSLLVPLHHLETTTLRGPNRTVPDVLAVHSLTGPCHLCRGPALLGCIRDEREGFSLLLTVVWVSEVSCQSPAVCVSLSPLSWYLKAQHIAPKNGRPYNQLALLAIYTVRPSFCMWDQKQCGTDALSLLGRWHVWGSTCTMLVTK